MPTTSYDYYKENNIEGAVKNEKEKYYNYCYWSCSSSLGLLGGHFYIKFKKN